MPEQKTHVVAFFPDGVIEHTRSAAMDALFGMSGEMRRVSEIMRDPIMGYYIKWLMGPFEGCDHTRDIARNFLTPDEILDTLPVLATPHTPTHTTLFFDTYEGAVAHEVQVLNGMRKNGVRFASAL